MMGAQKNKNTHRGHASVKCGVLDYEKRAVEKWVEKRGYESVSQAIRILVIEPALREFPPENIK